ncbi:MAG TPA: acyltransferase [Anaerolineae bacterium]|nr:acyltransferase [Anaerolineae bacterium]
MPFFTVNRSFFMSLFFMISGYCVGIAYDAKGAIGFLRSRLQQLGIPLVTFSLVFMLILRIPAFASPSDQSGSAWAGIDVGYLWYVEHLLILSICYARWRSVRKESAGISQDQAPPPGTLAILGFALLLAAASAVIRIWYPIDRWVNLLGFIRMAPADVPRDLSFFIIGAIAYRHQWFLRFPAKAGMRWLLVGVTVAILWYGYVLGLKSVWPIGKTAMGVIYPVWESLLCCGMCIGLLVLFREKFNVESPLSKRLAQSQYMAYLCHGLIVIPLQWVMLGLNVSPLAKFVLVTLTGIPLTFLSGYWNGKLMGGR